ncbi:hypothetical protein NODU109028_00595 [Nocardioides dubius]|uniref:Hemerythrin HHE cation binding domain-containing protein n=1 Tax=Nocardioides dubius TaxID=317019 RepID=A0ABP4EMM2_9ACTN
MTHNTLERSTQQTHEVLTERLESAAHAQPSHERPRDRFPAIDTFLASTSRHVAAATDLLPRAAQHQHTSAETVHELREAGHHLEIALARTKAKLYGEAHAVRLTWPAVWREVDERFAAYWASEEALVAQLTATLDDDQADELAMALYRAELRAPTRPHPYVPHRGLPGRVARRICVRVDRFWDTTEGRMVPEPVRPHDRDADGPLTQYLLADPHFPEPQD